MPRLSYVATIARASDEVFAFVSNAENNPKWHAHVEETHWLDGQATGLGRRARQTGHLWGRDWTFVAEIVEWEPGRLVTFQVIKGLKARTSIRIEPDPVGTRLSMTVTTPPDLGPLDAIVSRAMERLTASQGRADIRRLEAALAASDDPAPTST
jgi:uncharacterized membrane protein